MNPFVHFENWLKTKADMISFSFWGSIDQLALIALTSCIFLAIFGLNAPKKWAVAVVAVYCLLKIFQYSRR